MDLFELTSSKLIYFDTESIDAKAKAVNERTDVGLEYRLEKQLSKV